MKELKYIIANTMSEYIQYARENYKPGETRYIGHETELYGVRGEVISVNYGYLKFDTTAHETLAAYEMAGLISVTHDSI